MKYDAPKRIGMWKINIESHCEKDGDFMVVLKISETPQETFSVNQQIYVLDDNTREYFEPKKVKRQGRKRHSSRSKKKPSENVSKPENENNE